MIVLDDNIITEEKDNIKDIIDDTLNTDESILPPAEKGGGLNE